MAIVIGSERTLELLVNCKTYPAVSQKYTETVCTGGVEPDGKFVRLYPIPFRFLDKEEQYERWDVIRVRAYKDTKDSRPESWHIVPGAKIARLQHLNSERQRWDWMRKAVFSGADEMAAKGLTNGLVEIEPLEFYWKPDEKKWTASQLNVFQQGTFFDTKERLAELADRVPWQFRLRYREVATGNESDGKVLAWSLYQGYRRQLEESKNENAALDTIAKRVRDSIFSDQRAVYAILGTHSRFGHWMISAIYHLPRSVRDENNRQGGLF